jgi:hypothetical protein
MHIATVTALQHHYRCRAVHVLHCCKWTVSRCHSPCSHDGAVHQHTPDNPALTPTIPLLAHGALLTTLAVTLAKAHARLAWQVAATQWWEPASLESPTTAKDQTEQRSHSLSASGDHAHTRNLLLQQQKLHTTPQAQPGATASCSAQNRNGSALALTSVIWLPSCRALTLLAGICAASVQP